MVLQDLNEGKFYIQDGVIYTLTPLTKIEKVEEELKKEIEVKMFKSSSKETLLRLLGSAIEYFTERGWKICILNEKPDNLHLVIAAPFNSGIIKGNGRREDGNGNKTFQVYIPKGFLGFEIQMADFPHIVARKTLLLPNIHGISFRELCKNEKYRRAYRMVHPHMLSENRLCDGLPFFQKFDINMIVSQIEACINGSKINKTSLFDYNFESPAARIEDCVWGRTAYDMNKDGKSDDEIWKELTKHDRG